MPQDTDQDDILKKALSTPKKVEVDNKTVEQHSLSDLIALDKYVSAKKAVSRRGSGLRFAKLEAGGAV